MEPLGIAGLAGLRGQERAVARLRSALASGKAHHAYLFEGPEGVGKRTAAYALAQAWNCLDRPGEGCGTCTACRKIAEGNHPDVRALAVFNEEGKVKDQALRVRELLGELAFPPHEGRARVVVIDPADELNPTASNILLKTLEEPPAGTHFVLVTPSASRLLVTIRSRCMRVGFGPLPDEEVRALLVAHKVDATRAGELARAAGGSVGRALLLGAGDELPRRRERAGRLLQAVRAARTQGMLEAAGEMSGDRDEAMATLDLLWLDYHRAMRVACGLPEAEEAGLGKLGLPALLRGIRAVEEAQSAVRGFVSPQLALERMLLRLGEARGA